MPRPRRPAGALLGAAARRTTTSARWGGAAPAAATLCRYVPRGAAGAILLCILGRAERELGLEEEARSTLQCLLDEHPQSIYAGEVRAELGTGAADNPLAGF